MRKTNEINVLALAYLGDAVYELYIREYLLNSGLEKAEKLQKEAVKFVSAKNQAKVLETLIENDFFNQEELSLIFRARNHKGNRHPKNTDILTYKHSTGFEAVIGYLHLNENYNRIKELMNEIFNELKKDK